MPKPENPRRKRQAAPAAPQTYPLTIKIPMELFNRMDAYKSELKRKARLAGRGQRGTQWIDIIGTAVEEYLKKNGA
jgi:hypothetical protein